MLLLSLSKYFEKCLKAGADLTVVAVAAIHAIAVQNQERNILPVQFFFQQHDSAGGLLAAPVTEIDDTVRMQILCQFRYQFCFAFIWSVVDILNHFFRQCIQWMFRVQWCAVIQVHLNGLNLVIIRQIEVFP